MKLTTIGKKETLTFILIFLAFCSMLPNLSIFQPRGDEPLRLTLAYEMFLRGDYIQPTRLGELYFHKPPMFMWLIIIFSKFVGWNILTVRLISVLATLFTSLLIGYFGYKVFKNLFLGLVAGLTYIAFGEILFYYGFLGEIDATFSLIISAVIFFLYLGFSQNKKIFIVLAGIFTAIGFLLKGFNAYGFYGITIFALSLYYKNFHKLFSKEFLFSYFLSIFVPVIWLLQTADPIKYLETMFYEVSSRAEGTFSIKKFLIHIISFPVQNLKQTLLSNILAILVLLKYRTKILKYPVPALLLVLFFNYLPYLLFAGGKGMYSVDARYVVPLFSLLAVVFAFIFLKPNKKWIINTFFAIAVISIILRFIYGVVFFPKITKQSGDIEKISADIVSVIGSSHKIGCGCKIICFYLERNTEKIVVNPDYNPNWEYLVTCSNYKKGKLIKRYIYKGEMIYIYKR